MPTLLDSGKAAKGLKCAANSLVAGTLVHTEQGVVPIEWVKVGERVLSWDERTGETSVQPVMELFQHEGMYDLVKVTLESGEQLEATSGHPFYVQGKGWNAAANLKVGDALLLYNGTTVVVKTVDVRVGRERVYNFAVAQNANYFVGSGGVGVHNVLCKHFDDFDAARRDAFEGAGMTNPEDVVFSKYDSKTGTVVEFKGINKAKGTKVAYDSPHADMDASLGHDKPHVGWQTPGKKAKSGGIKVNNTYNGIQHPYRPSR